MEQLSSTPKAADRVGGTRKVVKDILVYILMAIAAVFYLVPFFMVIINSFKQKKDIIKAPMELIGKSGMSIDNYVISEGIWKLPVYHRAFYISGYCSFFNGGILHCPCQYHVRKDNLCADDCFYDHSVPVYHDSAGINLRCPAQSIESQTFSCVYAHRFCDEYVGIYVCRFFEKRSTEIIGGSSVY